MALIERYIFRTALLAFIMTLGSLTAVIWITTALRELDLVSSKGQTVAIFMSVTMLTLPAMIMIIAPVALFVAILYALNKLNSDSELIVMSAAGAPPWRIVRPLALLTLAVALVLGYITLIAMPASFKSLRDLLTQIRADVVAKVLQEGRFTTLDKNITFHFRQKNNAGTMYGILIHDGRDPKQPTTYLAERGQIVTHEGRTYMVLDQGSVHRQGSKDSDNAIVAFQSYAIDLDQFANDAEVIVYKPRERSTYDLLHVDPNELYARIHRGRFRSELHERFAQPLYAFASLAIAFAALGAARTTRQNRGLAIAGAIAAVVALRIAGFSVASLTIRAHAAWPLIYAVPLTAIVAATLVSLAQFNLIRRPPFFGRGGPGARPAAPAARPLPAE